MSSLAVVDPPGGPILRLTQGRPGDGKGGAAGVPCKTKLRSRRLGEEMMTKPIPLPEGVPLYTVPETAELLHVTVRTVRRQVQEGRLRTIKIGPRTVIGRRDLKDFLERRRGG